MQTTYKINIYQDGELKKSFENQNTDMNAFGWLLHHQGNSVDRYRFNKWLSSCYMALFYSC